MSSAWGAGDGPRDERALDLGVVFEEVLSWVRTLPGSEKLRSMVVFDEVYGSCRPTPPIRPPNARSSP